MQPIAAQRLVMAHGAGSSSGFVTAAFAADRLGVAQTVGVDDRTGRLGAVMTALAAAAADPVPTLVGGVSLGAHAAGALLARADRPAHITGGVLALPAWTGSPDAAAELTTTAAAALEALGPSGVLAELDEGDWVTPQLREAWSLRRPADLVAELRRAATQPAPSPAQLAAIDVPVVVLALADDPLHPASVARRWADLIPVSALVVVPRDAPGDDLTVFATETAGALAQLGFAR